MLQDADAPSSSSITSPSQQCQTTTAPSPLLHFSTPPFLPFFFPLKCAAEPFGTSESSISILDCRQLFPLDPKLFIIEGPSLMLLHIPVT